MGIHPARAVNASSFQPKIALETAFNGLTFSDGELNWECRVKEEAVNSEGENPDSSVLSDLRRPLERFGRYMATAAVLFMIVFAGAIIFVIESGYIGGESRQFDFVAFWAAGKLALAGDPIAAFDIATLREAQSLPPDTRPGNMHWFYPPALQYLFVPFALMPYWVAFLSFNLISMVLFARALWKPAIAVPMGHNLLVGAPSIIISFRLGQLAILWPALLVFALRAMQQGRPAAAGVLIGLLTLKPQLGILIPLVLVARGAWGVILWASITAIVVHGLPTLAVGLDYWAAFFERIQFATDQMGTKSTRIDLMVSPYAFVRYIGLTHEMALAAQYAVTAGLAIGLAVVWRRRSTDFNMMVGMLLIAIPAATHYSYYYELTLCIPAAIYLVRGGYGAATVDRILLALVLFGPASFFVSTQLAPLMAPVLVALFARAFLLGGLNIPASRPRPMAGP
ncbi:MAG: glycosyltransferase family 87 protein [Limibaculum sp.]